MKTYSAGEVLFVIITAFVLSLIGATLVLLTTNQYRMINSEIERTIAFYFGQAAAEWAIYNLYTDPGTSGWIPTTDSDGDGFNDSTHTMTEAIGGVTKLATIVVEEDAGGISDYSITVITSYES